LVPEKTVRAVIRKVVQVRGGRVSSNEKSLGAVDKDAVIDIRPEASQVGSQVPLGAVLNTRASLPAVGRGGPSCTPILYSSQL
jgi:hypothetical protein